MAFPTTSVLDNFNRANGPLNSGSWAAPIVSGNQWLSIIGNVAGTGTAPANSYWNSSMTAPLELYATVPTLGSGTRALVYCISNPGTSTLSGYKLNFTGTSCQLAKITNAADTLIGSATSVTIAAGDVIGVYFDGATHTFYKNGTQIAQYTDNSYQSGFVGLLTTTTTPRFDDLGGGSVAAPPPSGFPTTPVIDNFNRADANPAGGNWTAQVGAGDPGLKILTNQLRPIAALASGYYNASQYNAPLEAYISIPIFTSGSVNLYYCIQNPSTSSLDAYAISVNVASDTLSLLRVDSNAETTLRSISTPINAGDVIGVSYDGSVHTIYVNGTQVTTVSDNTYQSGYYGVWIGSTSTALDDLGGGMIAPPPPTSTITPRKMLLGVGT